MILIRAQGGRLKIGKGALDKMLAFRQTGEKLEAGGVLVGRSILNTMDVVIDDVSVPMSGDIRKRTYFKRNKAQHQAFVCEKWRESEGTCNYLGEWHTHPEPFPTPSVHDLRQWKKILRRTDDVEKLFFIIVGTAITRVWEGCTEQLILTCISGMEDIRG